MNLGLYLRVIWRFRILVGIGLLLAFVLAFLSFAKVSFSDGISVSYREDEQYASYSTIFITEQGKPFVISNPAFEADAENLDPQQPIFADPGRFASLAVLYAQLVTSDAVLQQVYADGGPLPGYVEASPILAGSRTSDALPLLQIAGICNTAECAVVTAARMTEGFRKYLRDQQEAAGVPPKDRVVLEVIRQPSQATLIQGRSTTRPVVVFLAVTIAFLALAFVLENLRPRGPRAQRATAREELTDVRREAPTEVRREAPVRKGRRSA